MIHPTAMSAVFCVEQIDCMECRSGTGKKVENKSIGFVSDEETQRIMNRI